MNDNLATDASVAHRDAIFDIHRNMQEISAVHALNEEILDQLVNRLDEAACFQDSLYWLSLARINELTIVCADNYARNCEFALAGDLLINPRLILIHLKGRAQPIVKKRHTPLTEQFKHMAPSRDGVITWLKSQTLVETRKRALLPHLLDRMIQSGFFQKSHIKSVENREKRVADTISLLACRRFQEPSSAVVWLPGSLHDDRVVTETGVAPCGFEQFVLLGKEMEAALSHCPMKSRFLKMA
jgi:hypothetical protein